MAKIICDGTDTICPYCHTRFSQDGEYIDERPRNEECGECGKIYEVWQEICVTNCTRIIED
jgi:hypothetical protein